MRITGGFYKLPHLGRKDTMPGTLTAADRRYNALIDKICEDVKSIEVNNLKRYHHLGKHFTGFCRAVSSEDGADRNPYGDRTVDRLAEDLVERGVFQASENGSVTNVRRALYWAKNLYDSYTDFTSLQNLADQGFTLAHAKPLFSLDDKTREEVENNMIVDGKVIPSRSLPDLITKTQKKMLTRHAEEALDDLERAKKGETPVAEEAKGDEAGDGDIEIPDQGEGEKEEEGSDKKEGNPPQAVRPREWSVQNPLKVVRAMDKTVTKAHSLVGDVCTVIREASTIGFDSDRAMQNYNKSIGELRDSLTDATELLNSLLKQIHEEVGGLPARS